VSGVARWLPQSLFGRLVLVLAGGLFLAQVLSAAINVVERDRLLVAAGGMQQAQRIADVVRLLDSLGPAERERIAAVLNVPPLVLSLHSAPTAAAEAVGPRPVMFAALLRASVGAERELRVEAAAPLDAKQWPPGPGRRHMMGRPPWPGETGAGPTGPLLRTQVKLRDGTWARFDSQQPPPSAGPPWRLALSLGVLLAAVLVLAYYAVRRVTRPLHVLADAADALGRDIHRPPLPEDGPTEIRRAAQAFNSMQQRLVRFIDERTRIFAAMSHDLKTPITRMRLRADLLEQEDLRQRFESDLKEMETMVTQALGFMRGLGGDEAPQEVDIDALVDSVESDSEAMGRDVRVEGEARSAYTGRASLLRRCLGNLVDNAVLYGGRALVRIEDTPASLTIRVLDDGPGIPEAQRDKVFEPFYRLEQSRNRTTGGSGLGLAIARNIARMHGGDIVLENRPQGGLEAVLTLPRS
jgi:signal transduction histidine kinase